MTNKDIDYHSGLNSDWTKNLAKNQRPDGKALLDHLKTIHQHNAGFTEKCASICRDRSGRNSYEWLADAVPDINGTRVLDLACGSGPLLKILHDRNKNFKLKGVDMCGEELSLAKARMSDGVVDLFQLEAQNLTAIKNASIDVVLCHWALTLMDPITPVLKEINRILSSGGKFAALVNGPMNTAPGYLDVYNLIYKYVQTKLPNYGKIDLGDPRIRSTKSLEHLVGEVFPSAEISIENNVVSLLGPVTEVSETAAGFFYASFILPTELRMKMLSDLSNLVSVSKQEGRFVMPISRLIIKK